MSTPLANLDVNNDRGWTRVGGRSSLSHRNRLPLAPPEQAPNAEFTTWREERARTNCSERPMRKPGQLSLTLKQREEEQNARKTLGRMHALTAGAREQPRSSPQQPRLSDSAIAPSAAAGCGYGGTGGLVRYANGPDGTRGFHAGRGRGPGRGARLSPPRTSTSPSLMASDSESSSALVPLARSPALIIANPVDVSTPSDEWLGFSPPAARERFASPSSDDEDEEDCDRNWKHKL